MTDETVGLPGADPEWPVPEIPTARGATTEPPADGPPTEHEAATPAQETRKGVPAPEQAAAPQKPADEPQARRSTDYVILKWHTIEDPVTPGDELSFWTEHGRATGVPKGAVLRNYVQGLQESERIGEWKAVAASAWKGGIRVKPPTGPTIEPIE